MSASVALLTATIVSVPINEFLFNQTSYKEGLPSTIWEAQGLTHFIPGEGGGIELGVSRSEEGNAVHNGVGSVWSTGTIADATDFSLSTSTKVQWVHDHYKQEQTLGDAHENETYHTEFALFVVKNSAWVAGTQQVAGGTHNFKGLAVKVHFTNDGSAELELLVNQNGKKSMAEMRTALKDQGHSSCLAKRPGQWHGNTLSIKLMIHGPVMFVLHDAFGSGEWRDCIDASFLWPHEVLENVHIGMAAIGPQSTYLSAHVTVPFLTAQSKWDDHHDLVMEEGYITHYEPAENVNIQNAAIPQDFPVEHDASLGEAPAEDLFQYDENQAQHEADAIPADDMLKEHEEYMAQLRGNWHGEDEGNPFPNETMNTEGMTDEEKFKAIQEQELQKLQQHDWAMDQRLDMIEKTLHSSIEEKLTALEEMARKKQQARMDAQVEKLERLVNDAQAQAKTQKATEDELTSMIDMLEKEVDTFVQEQLQSKLTQLEAKVSTMIREGILSELGTNADPDQVPEGEVAAGGGLSQAMSDLVEARIKTLEEALHITVVEHVSGSLAQEREAAVRKHLDEQEISIMANHDAEVVKARASLAARAVNIKSRQSSASVAMWAFCGLFVLGAAGFGLGYSKMKSLEKRFAGGMGLLSPRDSNKLI